jgi:hypothetical protein
MTSAWVNSLEDFQERTLLKVKFLTIREKREKREKRKERKREKKVTSRKAAGVLSDLSH